MPEPYTQLYVHLVWATWNRQPLLVGDLQQTAYACVQQKCSELAVQIIAMGGTADHMHLLVRMPTQVSVSSLAKQVKGSSSHLMNHLPGENRDTFKWQGGYAAFTVSKSLGPKVRAYIINQEQHHKEGTTDSNSEIEWPEPVE